MVEKMRILKKYFPMSARGWLIYFVAMGLASALCALLQRVSTSDVHVPMIFVLMVLIIALMTDGQDGLCRQAMGSADGVLFLSDAAARVYVYGEEAYVTAALLSHLGLNVLIVNGTPVIH